MSVYQPSPWLNVRWPTVPLINRPLDQPSFDQPSLINRPLTNRPLTKRPYTMIQLRIFCAGALSKSKSFTRIWPEPSIITFRHYSSCAKLIRNNRTNRVSDCFCSFCPCLHLTETRIIHGGTLNLELPSSWTSPFSLDLIAYVLFHTVLVPVL